MTLPADDGAPGWRGAMLPQPIAIAADRVYTASYFAPSGGYAFGDRFFAGQAQVAGPLTAPASDDVGSNGVFRCSGGFPHRLVPRGIVRGRRQLETPLVSEPVGAG